MHGMMEEVIVPFVALGYDKDKREKTSEKRVEE